jgi:hypothetical protein
MLLFLTSEQRIKKRNLSRRRTCVFYGARLLGTPSLLPATALLVCPGEALNEMRHIMGPAGRARLAGAPTEGRTDSLFDAKEIEIQSEINKKKLVFIYYDL